MPNKEVSLEESIQQAQIIIEDYNSLIYKYEDYPEAANHIDIITIAKDSRDLIEDLLMHIFLLKMELDPEYFDEDYIHETNSSELKGFMGM